MSKKVVPIITTILIMIIIFTLSGQNSGDSSDLSRGFTAKIIDIIAKEMDSVQKTDLLLNIHSFIRKCAHFFIYTLLGISSLIMMKNIFTVKPYSKAWTYAIILCFIYAATDEFHQLFIDGRSGEIADVLLDTAGSLFGSGIFSALRMLFNLKRRNDDD